MGPMPDDFWPDIKIIGRDGSNELGVMITKEELADLYHKEDVVQFRLKNLRFALWQARQVEKSYE